MLDLRTREDAQMRMERVDQLDLEPIAYKLVHPEPGEAVMSIDKADRLIAKYRGFLKLCVLYPERRIVPSKEVDMVWHTHILDTHKYAEDCQVVFGFFLHHFPYQGLRGQGDLERLRVMFSETERLYLEHFGENLVETSPSVCSGGNCEGGSCSGRSNDDITHEHRPRLIRS